MLTGSLLEFSLLGVLQMLLNGGRTGHFEVAHPRGGDVWMEGGEVVHAQALGRSGLEALSLLASVNGGDFRFTASSPAPDRSISTRRDAVLQYVWKESEAWPDVLRVFPDWTRPVRFTSAFNENLPVNRLQYRVLSLVGQGHVGALVTAAPMPPRSALSILLPFVQSHYVELV